MSIQDGLLNLLVHPMTALAGIALYPVIRNAIRRRKELNRWKKLQRQSMLSDKLIYYRYRPNQRTSPAAVRRVGS